MNVTEALQQIQQLKRQLILNLDTPDSVKLQVKQVTLIQKQLKAIKKEINAVISSINQQATQSGTDSIASIGLDVFGKHKWAGRVRAETRRVIEREKRAKRQPYIEIKEMIDNLILEGDRLKLLAEQYLLNK
jgi:small-conductance mechanosensitive channel